MMEMMDMVEKGRRASRGRSHLTKMRRGQIQGLKNNGGWWENRWDFPKHIQNDK